MDKDIIMKINCITPLTHRQLKRRCVDNFYLPALAASLILASTLTRDPILLGLGQFLVVKDDPLRPADLPRPGRRL